MLLRMARSELGAAIERHLGERSQTWLAQQAHTTQPTISRIIRGVHVPAPDTVEAIAKALEIDTVYLLRLAGLPIPEQKKGRDPAVEYLADRLDALPDNIRAEAIDALAAQLDAIYSIHQYLQTGKDPQLEALRAIDPSLAEEIERRVTENQKLIDEARAVRPDLAERAEAIKRQRQAKADKKEHG